MPDRIVIDASVAIAILVRESGTDRAQAATTRWSQGGSNVFVPSHFWVEVTNALVRRHARPAEEAIVGLVVLDELVLTTVELDRPTLLLALDQMAAFRLSAYDAVYLALAISIDAVLATFDRRLAEAAGDRGLLIGAGDQRRTSEAPAVYGSATVPTHAWAHSAVVGAHIADLRRQARLAGG